MGRIKGITSPKKWLCPHCTMKFSFEGNLNNHLNKSGHGKYCKLSDFTDIIDEKELKRAEDWISGLSSMDKIRLYRQSDKRCKL